MIRRLGFAVSGVLGLFAFMAAMTVFGRQSAPDIRLVTPTAIDGPAKIVAGEPLELEFQLETAGAVRILALSGVTPIMLTPTLPSGESTWTVPTAISETAGNLTFLVGDRQLNVDIAPAAPAPATEILVGPRSIVADGADSTLAVVAPSDIYGNPMSDGTRVDFERKNPTAERSTSATVVDRSLAWSPIIAGTKAGENSLWVTSNGTTGVPATVTEVPGLATPFELAVEAPSIIADGRKTIELSTNEVFDAFGNRLPDGVAGVFTVTSRDMTTLVSATIQQGRLRAFLAAPNEPVEMRIVASINGQVTEPSTLSALVGVDVYSVVGAQEDDGYRVEIGPVRDLAGAFVADGTEVVIGGQSTTTTDGYARSVIQTEDDAVVVSIMGRKVEHRIRR